MAITRPIRLLLFSLALTVLGVRTSPCYADQHDNPPPIPGWVHTDDLSDDTPEKHGIVLPGEDVVYSSPVIAEIDGDASDGKEVAVASADGTISVYHADGTLLWSKKSPNSRCGGSKNRLLSSPAVGELFGNGIPYVVVGYGGVANSRSCDGGVLALRGSSGATAWKFSIKSYASKEHFWAFSNAVFSSPALADVDADGKLEVGFGAFDRHVYLLNADGSVRWYYIAADTVWSSPAFANVDSDPDLEMIIGTDISANSALRPPTTDGGYVYAFKTAKRTKKKINFRDSDAMVWMKSFDQVIYSSPVVADVIPSSAGNEVIIQSGCYFPSGSSSKRGKWIKVLRASDGKLLRTLKTQACSPSSVAVGDVDGDGVNDIVATVNGTSSAGSKVMAWNARTGTAIWSATPRERGRNDSSGGNYRNPIIADVDGNGSLEVLVANGSAIGIFSGVDGSPLTCQEATCGSQDLMLFAWEGLTNTPAVGDIDGDNVLDIVAAGGHRYKSGSGFLYGWTDLQGLLGSPTGTGAAYAAPWPMTRGNAQHTAYLP